MVKHRDLFLRAQKGDREAKAQIAEEYIKLAYHVAYRYDGWLPQDELLSVAHLSLMKAMNTFDVNRGVQFTTYLGVVVAKDIKSASIKARYRTRVVHLDETLEDSKRARGHYSHVEDLRARREFEQLEDTDFAHYLLKSSPLTTVERWAIYLFIYDDLNQTEIGEELNLSQSMVSRLLRSSIRKMTVLARRLM